MLFCFWAPAVSPRASPALNWSWPCFIWVVLPCLLRVPCIDHFCLFIFELSAWLPHFSALDSITPSPVDFKSCKKTEFGFTEFLSFASIFDSSALHLLRFSALTFLLWFLGLARLYFEFIFLIPCLSLPLIILSCQQFISPQFKVVLCWTGWFVPISKKKLCC